MSILVPKDAKVNIFGEAIIPPGTEEIGARAFDGNLALHSVSVPGTVKRIGDRAFADCKNLKRAELAEGIVKIGSNVFTGCGSLKELTLPDSVSDLYGWAFYKFTGLEKPVYNRSKTVLYCYPCSATEHTFIVPDKITCINSAAFIENPYLEQVILPSGLEVISNRAFIECGIRQVFVPASVKRIGTEAFWKCKNLRQMTIAGGDTVISDGALKGCPPDMNILTERAYREDERLHWFGGTLLIPVNTGYPDGGHIRDLRFQKYAAECAAGNADAMWEFAAYFRKMEEQHKFFGAAANLWACRAAQRGCADAGKWLHQWLDGKNPMNISLPSILNDSFSGCVSGKAMYYAGFLFFDLKRSYDIEEADGDGIVTVSSWCGSDEPDETGFGGEEFYDWWYLDENFKELPGIGMLHSYSYRERRDNWIRFSELHYEAAKAIRRRRA